MADTRPFIRDIEQEATFIFAGGREQGTMMVGILPAGDQATCHLQQEQEIFDVLLVCFLS